MRSDDEEVGNEETNDEKEKDEEDINAGCFHSTVALGPVSFRTRLRLHPEIADVQCSPTA